MLPYGWKFGKGAEIVADYQRMYAILCAAASEALDALPEAPETAEAVRILLSALERAEELYQQTEADAPV